jgi:DNA gyrase subunit A
MGETINIDIENELKTSYMTYAMSVIVSRAIPDVRDGLKPVHRRILHSMDEMGLNAGKPYKKCGRIVGDVLGKFHPHGDQSIYDALVRLAQDYSMRYMAVDGHGNFGSVDGDPPAAMRYTEARLARIAELMLKDIKKETIDFGPNYDDSMEEPIVLPAAIPYLLLNGASGIAVGMATNMPPHNISEIVNATVAQIENPDISIDELLQYVSGPDFPTGGIIFGQDGIEKAYKTGKGRIKIRSRVTVEEFKKGREAIIVTEIPYQVKKSDLIIKIADLVKSNKIKGISNIRDESDRTGMRIVIELKKDIIPKVVLNQLYTHTNLQINYSINNLALDKGRPRVLTLKEMLQAFINHRMDVIYRRTRYELRKAEERAHIVEGLLKAIDNIDEVIKLIRSSKDPREAKERLIERFEFSDVQAQAILDMRLQKLTSLESFKLQEEYDELMKTIARLKEIISSDRNVLVVVRDELIENTKPFLDERKTEIAEREITEFNIEDLIQKENMVITITNKGFIKRTPSKEYKTQSKGGVGSSSANLREDDFIEHMFIASTHDHVLFFSNRGVAYKLKVHEIPQASKNAKGQPLKMFISIGGNEEINAILNVSDFSEENKCILFATRKGVVKKVALNEFERVFQNGKKAITLDDNDDVIDVKITNGENDLILASRRGKALRLNESTIRTMGRTARGVRGMKLDSNDELCGLCIVDDSSLMFLITEYGHGKRIDFDNFRPHGRGTGGQRYYKFSEDKGEVAAVRQVSPDDDIMVITSSGNIIRIASTQISQQGNYASGIRLVRLSKPDFVVAVARAIKQQS